MYCKTLSGCPDKSSLAVFSVCLDKETPPCVAVYSFRLAMILKLSFIDEMDTGYKKYLFDGEMSSPNLVVYKGTVSPFDDNSGQFIIGTPADKREIYQASLTGDGKLYLQKWVAKEYVTKIPRTLYRALLKYEVRE